MRAYWGALGIGGVAGALALVGCTGSLPPGSAATGGAGALALTGTGGAAGLAITGSGGATGGAAGTVGGAGGAVGGAAGGPTATGGTAGRSTVPDSHRASAAACSPEPDGGVWNASYDGGAYNGASSGIVGPTALDGGIISCASDSDCPPCQNGQPDRCHNVPQILHGPWCICDQCNSDQDCGPGSLCVCNQRGWSGAAYQNVCVPAQCRVDADCGTGGFCSPSPGPCGAIAGYYCHTAADTCWSSTDCPAQSPPATCVYSPATGSWGCGSVFCGG